jgi:hypothetical protein
MQSVGNSHWRGNKSGSTFLNTVEWSWQQEGEVLVENPRPSATVSTTGPSRTRLGLNPCHRGNRQSHIAAQEFLKFYRKINIDFRRRRAVVAVGMLLRAGRPNHSWVAFTPGYFTSSFLVRNFALP